MKLIWKILIGLLAVVVVIIVLAVWFLRGVRAELTVEQVSGTDPQLVAPDPQTVPTVEVAAPIGWTDGATPDAAEGLDVTRFAEGLEHPRVIYTLPNGDVLVSLTNAPERVIAGGGLTNLVAGFLFRRAGAAVPSPNQLVLLRDGDGDGVAEARFILRDDLDSPSGIGFHEGKLYVANHDEVLEFDYELGAETLAGEPKKLMDLPGGGNHWMRNLVVNEDGTRLYVAVGSASNIGEGGMEAEEGRAAIHELNLETGRTRIYGSGLRNPNGLAWSPWSGELWTTVNERDMLGSDLVPDYLTNVPVGVQYGWPWVYWGGELDDRVEAPLPSHVNPDYVRRPEYALGPHVAALGLVFSREGDRMGSGFNHGAFVARHGSWNRKPPSGYDVVFIPFDERGNPTGKPRQVLESFLAGEGETRGRPTWLAWDKTGALLVSDDTAGIVWRVVAPGAEPAAAIKRNGGAALPPQRELRGDPARAFEEPPADLVPGSL